MYGNRSTVKFIEYCIVIRKCIKLVYANLYVYMYYVCMYVCNRQPVFLIRLQGIFVFYVCITGNL